MCCMSEEVGIQFKVHPDHAVEYLGRRYFGVKLINSVWYFRDGESYKPFPLQNEIRVLQHEDGSNSKTA